MFKYNKLVALFLVVNAIVLCSAEEEKTDVVGEQKQSVEFVGRMLEQGRTLVHHALKRFMVLLPVVFFKLGIGATLLVLVTVVAINNGFIGFLLLVVGLSSVLARFQEARKQVAAPVLSAPYVSPALPAYYPHAHAHPFRAWDRSDSTADKTAAEGTLQYSPTYQYYTTPYAGYSGYAQNRA